jgi:hypothetical protein
MRQRELFSSRDILCRRSGPSCVKCLIFVTNAYYNGERFSAADWGTALQAGRSRVRFADGVIGIFHWHIPSSRTMALGLTQPNRNEYKECLLGRGGVKLAGACDWQHYHLHVRIVFKSGSFDLLEFSGLVQTCRPGQRLLLLYLYTYLNMQCGWYYSKS